MSVTVNVNVAQANATLNTGTGAANALTNGPTKLTTDPTSSGRSTQGKPMNRVVIVAGSGSDAKHVAAISAAAESFGLTVISRVASAHKTPEHAIAVLRQYDTDGVPTVFITVAGRSNALSAFADACVLAPVIACPPPSDAFGGADIWSSLRLPSGVASSVVLDPGNAALAAAKIFGVTNSAVRAAVAAAQAAGAAAVHAADTP